MTNPNESPQARLDAMVKAIEPGCPVPKHTSDAWCWDYKKGLRAVALDLLTQIDAANARAEAAEAQLSKANAALVTLREALEKAAGQWCRGIHGQHDPCEICDSAQRNVYAVYKEATSTTSHATSAAVERIEKRGAQKAVTLVIDHLGLAAGDRFVEERELFAYLTGVPAAILNRDEGERP